MGKDNLSPEEIKRKNTSRKRFMYAFIIVDILLLAYLITEIILSFVSH